MKEKFSIYFDLAKNYFKANIDFIRFIFVGLVNAIFGYSVFSIMIYIGAHYSLAVLISTILGIIFNFKTIGNIVFGNKNNKLFIKFLMVYAVIYVLNVGSLNVLKLCSINIYLSGALLLIPMSVISFILNKRFVFGDRT